MKLWYLSHEMREAEQEAKNLVDQINAEIPYFINGNVKIRMAWKADQRAKEIVPLEEWRMYGDKSLTIFIPKAELLVNDVVYKCDLLDLVLLDMYSLQLGVWLKNRIRQEGESANA